MIEWHMLAKKLVRNTFGLDLQERGVEVNKLQNKFESRNNKKTPRCLTLVKTQQDDPFVGERCTYPPLPPLIRTP